MERMASLALLISVAPLALRRLLYCFGYEPPRCSELCWRLIAETAVRPLVIVAAPPHFDNARRLRQAVGHFQVHDLPRRECRTFIPMRVADHTDSQTQGGFGKPNISSDTQNGGRSFLHTLPFRAREFVAHL